MLDELNLGRNRVAKSVAARACMLKSCSQSKIIETGGGKEGDEAQQTPAREECKRNGAARQLASDRAAAQIKDGDVVNLEPASDACHAAALGPASSTKLAPSK